MNNYQVEPDAHIAYIYTNVQMNKRYLFYIVTLILTNFYKQLSSGIRCAYCIQIHKRADEQEIPILYSYAYFNKLL